MNKLIYITAFTSGFVLMGFEIFGTRVLSPYFGSGMHIWGALIAVVLTGLSIGYAVGGFQADKSKPEIKLIYSLGFAGVLLVLFPPLSKFVCLWVDLFEIGSKASTFICAVILFLIPSFFIGMISPLLVKLKVKSVDSVGKGAGSIYSVATAGSIIGTITTAYFLIGELSSSKAIEIFGGILITNSVIIILFLKGTSRKEDSEA